LTPSRPEKETQVTSGTELERSATNLQLRRHFAWSRLGFESPWLHRV
jgi:hypothetical protein